MAFGCGSCMLSGAPSSVANTGHEAPIVGRSNILAGGIEMLRLFLRLMLVVGIGMTGAACQDDGYAAPRGYYQPAPTGYSNPYYNNGYYSPAPAPSRYGYTTVTVTNRGQNGYRDDVVQQQVVCGSQYYDGYRTRTAPRC
jgi:hypothetical protein